jgi:hypothetical protein
MTNCLLLLTAQLMTACDLNTYFDHRKLDHGMEIDFLDIYVMEQDVIVGFVRINAFHANIDVNDNKQLFWF